MTDCYDKYSTAYYCNSNGVYYCCKPTVNTKFFPQCLNNLAANTSCTTEFTTPQLKYTYCVRDDANCGNGTQLTATTTSKQIYANAMNYSTNTVCYY